MARSKLPFLLPAAKRDVKKAYEWYEEQKSGLGDRFLERVEECLRTLAAIQKHFNSLQKTRVERSSSNCRCWAGCESDSVMR